MVQLITTTRILSALETIPPTHRKDLSLPDNPSLGNPITHDQLIQLSRHLRLTNNSQETTLNALLTGTKVYVPPPPKKPEPVSVHSSQTSSHDNNIYINIYNISTTTTSKHTNQKDAISKQSPEYLALKARLLAAYEQDAYTKMTSGTSHAQPNPIFASSTPTLAALHDPAQYDDAEETLTPSLVFNIFLSVVITGFSVYFALRSFTTPELLTTAVSSVWRSAGRGGGVSESVRVLVSFLAAVGVGVAEVLIYVIYLGKVERARAKERKLKEKKEIVVREILGAEKSGLMVDGDKEEIWGRGPNGGLRRRVRERWEEDKEKSTDGDGGN
ncbi:endoplasmic reticulum-based factor for assembly of V-ATPase-domain-containing protein [Aspergillus avenaceus]|uniref:Endoplasmic reticulum-based factor for assembly of V-ATPase-domain-containing protein n=1 Tax=Aspergillus avenaceus TaxID=36643 RepID=A0A5N6TMM8_ASPAV|nr:endoplasmic reticulum-based factor for assembly of V-ATPase-domain-containing protein [Aspergillus avenaceus]